MRFFSIMVLVFGLSIFAHSRSLRAEGWSFGSLNPFASAEADDMQAAKETVSETSPIDSIRSGSKKFFSSIKDAVTPDKKPQKRQVHPWLRQPEPHLKRQSPEKKSWFSSLFKPKEPEVPESLDDWMSLKRQDP